MNSRPPPVENAPPLLSPEETKDLLDAVFSRPTPPWEKALNRVWNREKERLLRAEMHLAQARASAFATVLGECRRLAAERREPAELDALALKLTSAAMHCLGEPSNGLRPWIDAEGYPDDSLQAHLVEACLADDLETVLTALHGNAGLNKAAIPWERAACLRHYALGDAAGAPLMLACLFRSDVSANADADIDSGAPSLLARMCGYNPPGARPEDTDDGGRPLPDAPLLPEARSMPHPDVVRLLLWWRANPNARGTPIDPPLHYLLRSETWSTRHDETLDALLAGGADPEVRNAHGENAWDVLNREGSTTPKTAVYALVAYAAGGIPLSRWQRDRLALRKVILAVRNRDDALASLLERPDANAAERDEHGRTPLIHAVIADHDEALLLLLERGEPDATDGDGNTALLHAVDRGAWALFARLAPATTMRLDEALALICERRGEGDNAPGVPEVEGVAEALDELATRASVEAARRTVAAFGAETLPKTLARLEADEIAAAIDIGVAARDTVSPAPIRRPLRP